ELARHDSDLTAQIRRAASSVPANLGEGLRRAGRDRRYHFRVAAGSAEEVRAALRTAGAWGYVDDAALAESLALLDRVGDALPHAPLTHHGRERGTAGLRLRLVPSSPAPDECGGDRDREPSAPAVAHRAAAAAGRAVDVDVAGDDDASAVGDEL